MRYSGVVGLMALGLLASLAPAGIGAPPLAFSPGTTWTYRHVAARPPAPAEAGTATAVYGLVTHQGRSLHYIDITYELIPGLKERGYFEWTGTRLRHVGRVTADDANRVVETVYDRPLDPGVRGEGSGTTVITEGGVQRAVLSVRYAVSPGEIVTITVPAGTFQASRWVLAMRIESLEVLITTFTVGITDVREDTQTYRPGGHTVSYSRELVSGPVR